MQLFNVGFNSQLCLNVPVKPWSRYIPMMRGRGWSCPAIRWSVTTVPTLGWVQGYTSQDMSGQHLNLQHELRHIALYLIVKQIYLGTNLMQTVDSKSVVLVRVWVVSSVAWWRGSHQRIGSRTTGFYYRWPAPAPARPPDPSHPTASLTTRVNGK